MNSKDGSLNPVRATYFKFSSSFKWPESEAKFIESIILHGGDGLSSCQPMLHDTDFSRRQLYLRSYTFTTKKDEPSPIKRIKDKIKMRCRCGGGSESPPVLIFRRLVTCISKIDVLD